VQPQPQSQPKKIKKKPEEQQGEIESEPVIRFQEQEYPEIHSFEDAKDVIDTPDYKILDVKYENTLGWTLWTTIYMTLKADRHSYHVSNPNVHMKYSVTQGQVWLLVGVEGKVLHTGESEVVPAGHGHILLNRWEEEAHYTIDVPAKMDLREYLGLAMPESEMVPEAETGTEKRQGFQQVPG
jgi:hypothetical protein